MLRGCAGIVFLDFDGVLNGDETKERIPHPMFPGSRIVGIEPGKVKMISDFCLEHNLGIVISSTWREYMPLGGVWKVLTDAGLSPEVKSLGKTEVMIAKHGPTGIYISADRTDEIMAFVNAYGYPYVVFDDLYIKSPYAVRTHPSTGLTPADIEKARSLIKEQFAAEESCK